MPTPLYLGASAQVALTRRIDSIAANVANASTPGYQADGVAFESLLSRAGRAAYPAAGEDYISRRNGPVLPTGNSLDFAVRGDGYLALQSPSGRVFTRDGRMQITATGQLRSINNYPVLDASGSPIQVDPDGGPMSVSGDGMITQQGRQIGALGLFAIPPGAGLKRFDNSSVIPDRPATTILNFVDNGVLQGHLEQSNVDPVTEITRLIALQRAFDNISASTDMIETTRQDAIKTLGGAS